MNYADERYVRLYTRDTTTWKLLPWQAKALLPLLMRKLDRSGVLDLADDPVECIAAITDLPVEVVADGLPALTRRGIVLMSERRLVMPNFLRAQECRQSDKARKTAQRERERASAIAELDRPTLTDDVTKRDVESQNVTESHQPSHAVTASHTESLRTVPCRTVPEEKNVEQVGAEAPPVSPISVPEATMAAPGGPSVASEAPVVGVAAFALQTPATEAPSAKSRKPKPTDPTPDEQRVFDHWREKLQHPRATLDAKRLAKIRAALKTHGLERCLRAVDGIATSDWHRTNKQDDIELVLRDASHIEKYEAIALPLKPALRVVQTGPRPETPSERIERLKREFAAAANKDAANG